MEVEILSPVCCTGIDREDRNSLHDYTDQLISHSIDEGISALSDEPTNIQLENNINSTNHPDDNQNVVLDETVGDLEKLGDDLKTLSLDPFSIDLASLPYPPGYSIMKQNDSNENYAKHCKALQEIEDENSKEPRMTKKFLKQHCAKHKLYQTPQLNDILYLHYNGFSKIENLEVYTGLRCLFLEVNGILKIDGLSSQIEMRTLYLSKNLIRRIENLDHMQYLDTLDISHNLISRIENLDMLPNLTRLIISHNKLSEVEDLIHLVRCESLSVLDIQHNHIKDPNIVEEVFAKMPNLFECSDLHSINCYKVSDISNFILRIISWKNLTYLDDRPVFPKDRACAEAFYAEGIEKEREVRQQWIEAEQQKILDSVKSIKTLNSVFKIVPVARKLIYQCRLCKTVEVKVTNLQIII
ncbi:unnamed protein product [Heterobilharzia americana]|nr:unnamed protein product [Heterobilharzia americana]